MVKDAIAKLELTVDDMGNRKKARIDAYLRNAQPFGGGLTDTKPRNVGNDLPKNGANKIVPEPISQVFL